jgi:cytochrome P450/NADPH-cytochrome P450 reductase
VATLSFLSQVSTPLCTHPSSTNNTPPATRKSLEAVSRKVTISTTTPSLLELAGPLFESHILTPRISLLDILSRYDPLGSSFPLSSFLQSLPAMRIRSYSISSSALASPTRISLTISVLEAPSMWFSPDETGTKFLGVASNYIASLEAGESVQVAVRPSHQAFHPPSDPEETPVLMLCAGTGIAPFRGFCIERAEMVKQGRKLAKGILYVGVRREVDVLYKEEVAAWAEIGAVEVRHVFSRDSEKTMGCKYVQDRMWEEREELVELFDAGAKVFVCGSARLGEGVKDVVLKMYAETAEKRGKPKTEEEITKWFDGIRNERYAVDVFS